MNQLQIIHPLHFISQETDSISHAESIQQACEAGVTWVQLRVKDRLEQEVLLQAKEAKEICDRFGARLIINDYPEVAASINAYGLHLGKEDMAIQDARKIVGDQIIIGGTANTFEDIVKHQQQGADYVGLGPFRFTATKKNLSPVLGLEGYQHIMEQCRAAGIQLPVIAIGGILVNDIEKILPTGVQGIAVSSLIVQAKNKKEVVQHVMHSLSKKSVAC